MCRAKYVDEGSKEEIERYRKWIKKGKAWAMEMLSQRYRDGVGVKQSDTKAIELFEMAAKRGNATAQYNLGVYYDQGSHGVTQSSERAVEYWKLAANQGHPGAQHNLGNMYAQGDGIDQSYSKAREWITKAASQGNELAIDALKRLDEAEGRTTTPSSTVNSNTIFCSYCNKPEPTNTKFNRCKRCRSVYYCNRECQMKHWKTKPNGHKKQCTKLAAAFKTLNKKNEK